MSPRPIQYVKMTSGCCIGARAFVPRTAVASGPFQDLEMALLGCIATHFTTPVKSLSSRPLKDTQLAASCGILAQVVREPDSPAVMHTLKNAEVPLRCCHRAGVLWPVAAVRKHPLQCAYVVVSNNAYRHMPEPGTSFSSCPLKNIQMPPLGSVVSGVLSPRCAISPCPLKNPQVPILGGTRARCKVPGATVRSGPLKNVEVSAFSSRRARCVVPRAVLNTRPP